MFKSAASASRSGTQRYMAPVATYVCPHCGKHHITSRGITRADERDDAIERLVEALLGKIARAA
jgi:hypothetical protein